MLPDRFGSVPPNRDDFSLTFIAASASLSLLLLAMEHVPDVAALRTVVTRYLLRSSKVQQQQQKDFLPDFLCCCNDDDTTTQQHEVTVEGVPHILKVHLN